MGNFALSVLERDVSDFDVDGTSYADVDLALSHSTTAASMVITKTFTARTTLTSLACLGLSQPTGLSFAIELVGATTYNDTIAQTVETNPRDTSNMILPFASFAADTAEITITGITAGLSLQAALAFNQAYQPSINYQIGNALKPGTQRKSIQTKNTRFYSVENRHRVFDLPLAKMTPADRESLADVIYQTEKNNTEVEPLLVQLDSDDTSAHSWMVAFANVKEFKSSSYEKFRGNATFEEKYKWR